MRGSEKQDFGRIIFHAEEHLSLHEKKTRIFVALLLLKMSLWMHRGDESYFST